MIIQHYMYFPRSPKYDFQRHWQDRNKNVNYSESKLFIVLHVHKLNLHVCISQKDKSEK